MSEMLDLVARAVCDKYPGKCCKEYMGMVRCQEPKPGAKRIARAAIKAMKQADEAMTAAGMQAFADYAILAQHDPPDDQKRFAFMFSAACDAALEEPKEG